jgi:peptide/nickel transport system ATP-binding protein
MPLLEASNLRTYYSTIDGDVKAVDNISFDLEKGQTLGIAGESGCGKTTVALSIMRLLPPAGRIVSGKILLGQKDILEMDEEAFRRELRWKRISIIFQGAMDALNPLLKVGYQVAEPILFHEKVNRDEALEKAQDILEMVGINASRAESYPFEFSGGMKQRVMTAMSLACNPEIVIADEPTTALDVIVCRQIIDLMTELKKKLKLSLILITHDLSVIAQLCDKLAIMYAGKIVEISDIFTAYENPKHPYTRALISAFPNLRDPEKRIRGISDSPPSLINPPSGCRFNPRCPYAKDICETEEPELRKVGKNHSVACHFAENLF